MFFHCLQVNTPLYYFIALNIFVIVKPFLQLCCVNCHTFYFSRLCVNCHTFSFSCLRFTHFLSGTVHSCRVTVAQGPCDIFPLFRSVHSTLLFPFASLMTRFHNYNI